MPTYRIEFTKGARKEINKLDLVLRKRIYKAVNKLSINPRNGQVRPMIGTKSWRLRIGDYRVVYDIHDNKLIVLIVRVKHRRDAYRSS